MSKPFNRNSVLITGSILQLFFGILYVWSVFVMPVSKYFSWDSESVKLTSSFMLCSFVLGILISGKLIAKISSQKSVLLGGVMLGAGMILSGILPISMGFLIYITYGIIGGVGVGIGYNAILTSAQKNFPDKRGLAVGISVCAFGFSTVVFAPLVEFLTEKIGVNFTFLLIGGILIIFTLIFFSFIRMPEEISETKATYGGKQYSPKEVLKMPAFYNIAISMMFAISVFFILNPSFITLAEQRGIGEIATILVMITGIANAIGRLAIPAISDKIGCNRVAIIIITITALSAVSLIFVQGYALIAVIAISAFCYGGFSGVYPVITANQFGVKHVGSNYGLVMIGFALSALLFPILLGFISSMTVKFIVLAIVSSIGALLMIQLEIKNKKGKKI